jgi:hypothetical protein
MLRKFCVTLLVPGALTADKTLYFTVPSDCSLVHVSCCCQTQAGTVQISDDGTAITDSIAVTAGTTPVEADRDEMTGDQYPHIADGSVVSVAIGHGSNCVDMTVVMTFVEG